VNAAANRHLIARTALSVTASRRCAIAYRSATSRWSIASRTRANRARIAEGDVRRAESRCASTSCRPRTPISRRAETAPAGADRSRHAVRSCRRHGRVEKAPRTRDHPRDIAGGERRLVQEVVSDADQRGAGREVTLEILERHPPVGQSSTWGKTACSALRCRARRSRTGRPSRCRRPRGGRQDLSGREAPISAAAPLRARGLRARIRRTATRGTARPRRRSAARRRGR